MCEARDKRGIIHCEERVTIVEIDITFMGNMRYLKIGVPSQCINIKRNIVEDWSMIELWIKFNIGNGLRCLQRMQHPIS